MFAVEIAVVVIGAIGAWADVFLSTFNLCMQGTCRSKCCCMEMEHDDQTDIERTISQTTSNRRQSGFEEESSFSETE